MANSSWLKAHSSIPRYNKNYYIINTPNGNGAPVIFAQIIDYGRQESE